MDDELDDLIVAVRADTAGFARDVATMRNELEGPLSGTIDAVGGRLESGLVGALRRGSVGFDDLRRVALRAFDDITSAALNSGLSSLGLGAGHASGTGLSGLFSNFLGSFLGLPGRATGGSVGPGRAFLVGERGPEVFVPTSSGQIVPNAGSASGRTVNLTVTINAAQGQSAPQALARSSRQITRQLRAALQSDF